MMLDSLGGVQNPFFFDGGLSTEHSSSSISSGSPPTSFQLNNADITVRPSWLFTSQMDNIDISLSLPSCFPAVSLSAAIYGAQSTPTDALSSLLDPFSSPVSEVASPLSLSQLTGVPFKQMATNRFTQSGRRAFGLMTSPGASETSNPLGAPGTPISGSSMTVLGGLSSAVGNAPPPKNPKLYKTELCVNMPMVNKRNVLYLVTPSIKRRLVNPSINRVIALMAPDVISFTSCEAELLAGLTTPPAAMCLNVGTYTQKSNTTHTRGAMGGPGGPAMTPGILAPISGPLQRISSLPGYGSAGESPAGSSADSGSESPNGSFSPGLELEDNGPFTVGFMAPQPIGRRQQLRFTSVPNCDQKRDSLMNGLIGDLMSWTFEEKWDDAPGRLPVFAQLSNPQ
uniref:Mediator of RNA polymerase II transcription subunit 13 n=1 Tax=Heterorhabditis bacteriophora TaxID=37862 RepID=A0A1I7XKW9_HETBA